MAEIQTYAIEDMQEGMTASFKTTVSPEDIDAFAQLSGDINPLHISTEFARIRGFQGRVAHGALLITYVSRLFGIHLVGSNCLLHNIKINFVSPVYEGDEITIEGVVKQVSSAVGSIVAAVEITNMATEETVLRGTVQTGFTTEDGNAS